jgi:hypothetical protein
MATVWEVSVPVIDVRFDEWRCRHGYFFTVVFVVNNKREDDPDEVTLDGRTFKVRYEGVVVSPTHHALN